jgi:hypothetical protein
MATIADETIIKKTYRDSADVLLSITLAKITRPATLEDVLTRISSHVSGAGDTTALIRTLRNREYGS